MMRKRKLNPAMRTIYDKWAPSQDEPPVPEVPKPPAISGGFWATHEDLARLSAAAATHAAWDFATSLGDTIKEKYETLYQKLIEVTNVIIAKGAKGYFWIATSPEISSIFETATAGFIPAPCRYAGYGEPPFESQEPLGMPWVIDCGTVSAKWRLFKCELLPKNEILIGVDNIERDPCCYARMVVCNFIA